jgi:hypothetical protein
MARYQTLGPAASISLIADSQRLSGRDLRLVHQIRGTFRNSSGLSALRVKRASRTAPLK